MKDHEEDIILLNQQQLANDGTIDVTNPGYRTYYSTKYKPVKKRMATYTNTDFIDLHFDGDFYEGMKILYFQNYFVITDTDYKWPAFLETVDNNRFGKALGLTPINKAILAGYVKEDLLKSIRDKL